MTAFVAGDVLERDKGMVKHVGIYMGDSLVLHASPENGVAITSMTSFAKGRQVRLNRRTNLSPYVLFLRARAAIARRERYDLLGNNCIDLVNEVVTGKRENAVLIVLLCAIAVGGIAYALTR